MAVQGPASPSPSEESYSLSQGAPLSLLSLLTGLQILLVLLQVLLLQVNLSFGYALKALLLDALQALIQQRYPLLSGRNMFIFGRINRE